MSDFQGSLIEITISARQFTRSIQRVVRQFREMQLSVTKMKRKRRHRDERRARANGTWPITRRSPHRHRRHGRG